MDLLALRDIPIQKYDQDEYEVSIKSKLIISK